MHNIFYRCANGNYKKRKGLKYKQMTSVDWMKTLLFFHTWIYQNGNVFPIIPADHIIGTSK